MRHTEPTGRAEPSFAPDQLLSISQCSAATGLSVNTLHSYSSYRRSGVSKGPRPTRLPGARSVLYRWSDVVAYVEHGVTGAATPRGSN